MRRSKVSGILLQYKHLADVVDSAETYGRMLESQVQRKFYQNDIWQQQAYEDILSHPAYILFIYLALFL